MVPSSTVGGDHDEEEVCAFLDDLLGSSSGSDDDCSGTAPPTDEFSRADHRGGAGETKQAKKIDSRHQQEVPAAECGRVANRMCVCLSLATPCCLRPDGSAVEGDDSASGKQRQRIAVAMAACARRLTWPARSLEWHAAKTEHAPAIGCGFSSPDMYSEYTASDSTDSGWLFGSPEGALPLGHQLRSGDETLQLRGLVSAANYTSTRCLHHPVVLVWVCWRAGTPQISQMAVSKRQPVALRCAP